MFHWIYSVFVVLHGMVHLFYLAWSQGKLIPDENFHWNANSWLFSNWLGDSATRSVGMVLFGLAALLFVVSGIGVATRQGWGPTWVGIAAVASSLTIMLMWDGQFQHLSDKGFVGVLINIALLVGLYVFKYPAF